jgi:hydrogenase maturation protein HypF
VCNSGGIVEILAIGKDTAVNEFLRQIPLQAPLFSHIYTIKTKTIPFQANENSSENTTFIILVSRENNTSARFISPDLAICPACRRELFERHNRRHRHIFNTCTDCGPRFSVIKSLPYDRENTSMNIFPMCKACNEEYNSPTFRRFHAETISCKECGPEIRFISDIRALNDKPTGNNAVYLKSLETCSDINDWYDITSLANDASENGFKHELGSAVRSLNEGQIIAIKGIGGYHLACSPLNAQAVRTLRRLKGRDTKPFAIMFSGVVEIQKYCEVSPEEEIVLTSPAAPITLLPMKHNPFVKEVLCGNSRMGCFLPYTPLHVLLMEHFDMLILTSANHSGSALLYSEDELLSVFTELPGILTHNRSILRPLEDSVVQWNHKHMQYLRTGRGTSPTMFTLPARPAKELSDQKVLQPEGKEFLALGSDLKAAFCVVKNGQAYLSQYFGDLIDETVMKHYTDEIKAYLSLFNVHPEFILCDSHPGYHSTKYARSFGLPVVQIQHHHAHGASVFAEYQLDTDGICICFDGTGYGEDHHIWGGEVFIYHHRMRKFERTAHLSYTELLGGDSAGKDAMKTALCFQYKARNCELTVTEQSLDPQFIPHRSTQSKYHENTYKTDNDILIDHNWKKRMQDFDARADIVSSALTHNIQTTKSSSIGRLFDAVAALLYICPANDYEGQCAQMLEQAATEAEAKGIAPLDMTFHIYQSKEGWILDETPIIRQLTEEQEEIRRRPKLAGAAAFGFHLALAKAVVIICQELSLTTGIRIVALSGGVFQNRLLTRTLTAYLEAASLQVYCNARSVPNDNGIALGQAYLGWMKQ